MSRQGMEDLLRLALARFATAEVKLAGTLQKERKLRAQLAGLNAARAAGTAPDRDGDDAALRAGADVRWHRWIEMRKVALNGELARVLSVKDAQLRQARKAFGQKEALRLLIAQERRAAEAVRQRRSDQAS